MTGDRYRAGHELELALAALANEPHPLTDIARSSWGREILRAALGSQPAAGITRKETKP